MKTTDNQTAVLCSRGYKVSSSVGLRFCDKCKLFNIDDIRCRKAQELAQKVKQKFYRIWRKKKFY